MGFFPTVFAGEPTRRSWHERDTSQQYNGRNHLQSPRNPEGGVAVDEGGAVRNKVHDQRAPANHPVLEGNESASSFGRADLCDVKRSGGKLSTSSTK